MLFTPQKQEQAPLITLDKIYFLHLRSYSRERPEKFDDCVKLQPKGGATIAFKIAHELIDEEGKGGLYFLEFGVAHCCTNDMFNKRIGRDIATARLLMVDNQLDEVYWTKHPTVQEVITKVKELYYLDKEQYFPQVRAIFS